MVILRIKNTVTKEVTSCSLYAPCAIWTNTSLAEAFGGSLTNLSKVYHGIATPVELIGDSTLFEGIPKTFHVGRYHSWVVNENDLPTDLKITSKDAEGYIMSLEHTTFDVKGVQYHPESVLTPEGAKIIGNWLKN